jgi:hypothetical protein
VVVTRTSDRLTAERSRDVGGRRGCQREVIQECRSVSLALGLLCSAAVSDASQATLLLPILRFPQVLFVGGPSQVEGTGVDVIGCQVACLTGWRLDRLQTMRHGNGQPDGACLRPAGPARPGRTVAFNFLGPDGSLFDERLLADGSGPLYPFGHGLSYAG